MIEITYKNDLFTPKPYYKNSTEDFIRFLESQESELHAGTHGIYLNRHIIFKSQEFYFPFIDIDGTGENRTEKINSAITNAKLTHEILERLGIAKKFFFVATGYPDVSAR